LTVDSDADTGAAGGPDTVASDIDATLARVAGLSVLADCDVRVASPADPPPLDLVPALVGALERPTASPRLAELARGRTSAVVITSDATRAVPNREIIPAVCAELAAAGIAAEHVTVVFGGGAHRTVTPEEIGAALGGGPDLAVRAAAHDARASDCVSVGRTPRGTEVLLNRAVAEADVKIALGVVEPHEFAGFTGGRKAILPAVAAYDTIVHNHSVAMMDDPAARPGVLNGNPFHAEMVAAMRLAGLDFIVNVALDRAQRPTAVIAGEPEAAHAELVDFVRGSATVTVPSAPDLIVTGTGAPLDINLYQSLKALVAVEPLTGPDTVVALLSRCREGTGSNEMLEPFAAGGELADVMARIAADYSVEKDQSYLAGRFLTRCPQVVACCPGVSDDDLRTLRLAPAASVEEAVGRARRRLRSRRARPLVLLFPRPQRVLLELNDDTTDRPQSRDG
jgi:nickel-dependent lactate racemase